MCWLLLILYACHLLLHASWTTQSNYYPRYPKHIKEFEARDASRRVALNLPNVSYPIYPASVYQPYSFYLPDSYRIDQFYSANWNRYPGGIYSSGGMADGDKSHNNKWAPWIFCCWEDLLFFRYIFISNGAVERVVKEKVVTMLMTRCAGCCILDRRHTCETADQNLGHPSHTQQARTLQVNLVATFFSAVFKLCCCQHRHMGMGAIPRAWDIHWRLHSPSHCYSHIVARHPWAGQEEGVWDACSICE